MFLATDQDSPKVRYGATFSEYLQVLATSEFQLSHPSHCFWSLLLRCPLQQHRVCQLTLRHSPSCWDRYRCHVRQHRRLDFNMVSTGILTRPQIYADYFKVVLALRWSKLSYWEWTQSCDEQCNLVAEYPPVTVDEVGQQETRRD